MKILVTGGAGFIGSALCRRLLNDGDSVVNLDKLTYAASGTALADVEARAEYAFVHGDIGSADSVRSLLEAHEPDAVINLAAETHVDRSIDSAEPFIQTNVVATATLLDTVRRWLAGRPEEARRAFRFLHVSTDEVFGSLGEQGSFTETSPYDPRSPYSASKAASDHLASAWHHTYGLPTIISNCSNNYGPYQFPEKLIPLIILNALERRPLPVYGDGLNVRDWLHVDDHAAALALIVRRGEPGRSYGVGARQERSNLAVVEAICDLVDEATGEVAGGPRRKLIQFVADRPGHDRRYAMDPTRLETELGWRPTYDFERGLAETVGWYLDRQDWWRPLRERYEGDRLGLQRTEAAVAR